MDIETPLIAKVHFSRFLATDRLHFAAHSHHLWPDVTRDAALASWDDAARLADDKWSEIFGAVVPEAQGHIAGVLGLRRPEAIAFAPNTHEFLNRILSCFEDRTPVRVLSTTSEFHSFLRQSQRLVEAGLIELTLVETEPYESFEDRFADAIAAATFDVVYVSQVFFDSGLAVKDLERLCWAVSNPDTVVVIDGYHGFMALPTDLGPVQARAFYLAGGYKYAMSGEGACFLHVPEGCDLRPVNTGWFADFGALENTPKGGIAYADDGFRFFGATFDATGLYRLNAVMRLLDDLGVGVVDIHAHVIALQEHFFAAIERLDDPVFSAATLLSEQNEATRGHFLAFRHAKAAEANHALYQKGVITDVRGDCIRLGFGAYHDLGDVRQLVERIKAV